MSVGLVFASTGGYKAMRAVHSLRRMEPNQRIHILLDTTTNTWKSSDIPAEAFKVVADDVRCLRVNHGFVNGGLNAAIAWMQSLGHSHACLLHDDLVFSPLAEHRNSLSRWFDDPLLAKSSGLSFCHFEALVHDAGMDLRRKPEQWDREDMESDTLWQFLARCDIKQNVDICPPGASYFFRYEGPDIVRKWNRIGPTGSVVPIATWEKLGRFNESEGIFYDDEYATECLLREYPPIYAVTNFPYIHLHNQSVNPWADPAPGVWSDCVGAYVRRYGTDKVGIWRDDWEARWHD